MFVLELDTLEMLELEIMDVLGLGGVHVLIVLHRLRFSVPSPRPFPWRVSASLPDTLESRAWSCASSCSRP